MAIQINYIINGDSTIASKTIERSLITTGKVEHTFNDLIDTDGAISVSLSKLGTISYIIANGTDAKITITSNAVDSVIEVKGLLVYDVGTAYAGNITAITVETDSTTAVDLFLGVYGE